MSGIVEDVLSCTDDILGLRDDLGAIKHIVYILTRTWSGDELGSGIATDVIVQILPTPYLVNLDHNVRLVMAGKVKEGDIMLKHFSKQTYTEENMIDCSVGDKKTEKYYYVDQKLYNVVHIKSDYVYWNVHIRLTGKNKVYL